jgi:hypothetical protein
MVASTMRKKTLVWLTVPGWILFVFAGYLSISSAIRSGSEPSIQCFPGFCIFEGSLEAELIGFAASVLLTIACIGILIVQARQRQWVWFVLTIIFSYICMSIYLITVSESPSSKEVGYWQAPPQHQSPRLKKKTLVTLLILGTALLVIAVSVTFIVYRITSALPCSSDCTSADAALWKNPGFVALVVLLIASYLTSIALGIFVCAGSLIKQIVQRQWVWFTCTLLFGFIPILGAIYILIYLIAVPEMSQPILPAYTPVYQPAPPYQPYSLIWRNPSEE